MISDHSPTKISVLVLMPMLPGYEAIRRTVSTTVTDAKLELVWMEDLLEDWEWLNWLYNSVSKCDIVAAVPSDHNPFVMYEIGIARAYKRPMLIMLDHDDIHLSGSLDGSPFLLYSNAELSDFSDRLRADLLTLVAATSRPTDVAPDSSNLYRDAERILNRFNDETSKTVESVEMEAFTARLIHSMNHGTYIPALAGTSLGDAALLAAIVRSSRMVETMAAIREWVDLQAKN